MIIIMIIIIIIKHAYAGQLNSFTQLRALLVLHDRGILAHVTNVTGHYSSSLSNIPPSANYSSTIRMKSLKYWYYEPSYVTQIHRYTNISYRTPA